jgi:hypothetical protein
MYYQVCLFESQDYQFWIFFSVLRNQGVRNYIHVRLEAT